MIANHGDKGVIEVLTRAEAERIPELLRARVEAVCSVVKIENRDADVDTLRHKAEKLVAADPDMDQDAKAVAMKLLSQEPVQGEFGYWSMEEVLLAMGKQWEAEPSESLDKGSERSRLVFWAPYYHLWWDLGLTQQLYKRWGGLGLLVRDCMMRHMTITKGADYGEIADFPKRIMTETAEAGVEWAGKYPAKTVSRIQDTMAELGIIRKPGGKLGYKRIPMGERLVAVRRYFLRFPMELLKYAREHNLIPDRVRLSSEYREAMAEIEAEAQRAEAGLT